MTAVNEIKRRIQRLFHMNPTIHIDVSINRPKVRITNQEAVLKGVYSNVFQIETQGKLYTIQYVDVLTKNIKIAEIQEEILI